MPQKHKYFELAELIKSDVAKARGIDNTPSFEAVEHLDELVACILDPLRAAWGRPIHVTSGYRCPLLNMAVGGSVTSAHKLGYAADLQTAGPFDTFRNFVVKWFQSAGVRFDQVLLEKNKKTGEQWIHIGLYNNEHQQRGIIKVMEV